MKQRSRFDEEAGQWDQNPGRVEVARAVGTLICRRISLQSNWRVLDYGAGTGLLTLCIQPFVAEITALDTSDGMTAELRRKLATAHIENVQVRLWDLGAEPYPDSDFDLVVSSMTMHHIANVPLVSKRMAEALRPGGRFPLPTLTWRMAASTRTSRVFTTAASNGPRLRLATQSRLRGDRHR